MVAGYLVDFAGPLTVVLNDAGRERLLATKAKPVGEVKPSPTPPAPEPAPPAADWQAADAAIAQRLANRNKLMELRAKTARR